MAQSFPAAKAKGKSRMSYKNHIVFKIETPCYIGEEKLFLKLSPVKKITYRTAFYNKHNSKSLAMVPYSVPQGSLAHNTNASIGKEHFEFSDNLFVFFIITV